MSKLAFRALAKQADVPLRTLNRWRAEGMHVVVEGGRLFARLDHVLAWKRWKSLANPAAGFRRARAARAGESGAVVTDEQYRRAWREWVAAGGCGEAKGVAR